MSLARKPCVGPGSIARSSRREFLRAGALGIGGLSLGEALARRAYAGQSPELDTAVIFIWLPGGPPHLDMYDMKPQAPSDYRGEMRPIATNVSGMEVCELMPYHARCADKYSIIRSISHDFADHGGGHKRFLTGRIPRTPVDTVNDAPMVGSIVAKCREDRMLGIPNYIAGTDPGRDGVDVFAFGAAYLGPSYTPFSVAGDPLSPNFKVPNIAPIQEISGRLDDRSYLLQQFDRYQKAADTTGLMNSLDHFHQRAVNLLTSDRSRRAFDLQEESAETLARYGKHAWGARCLLARRLVEAGTSFVSMVLENPYQSGIEMLKQGTYNWDSHSVNCHLYDDLRVRLPLYDQAVTALIEDLYARGLDRRVLLVVTGEFGRTPRLENHVGTQTGVRQPGRDHWPQSMSLIVSGGGLKTGQIVGSTNSKGEHPKDRPMSPNDLWATVYRHLGIDPEMSFPDHRGRPMPILPFGQPIHELI